MASRAVENLLPTITHVFRTRGRRLFPAPALGQKLSRPWRHFLPRAAYISRRCRELEMQVVDVRDMSRYVT
jgi:hypothetical protein